MKSRVREPYARFCERTGLTAPPTRRNVKYNPESCKDDIFCYSRVKMASLQDSEFFFSFIPGLRFAPTWAMILRPFGTRFLFILLNIFKSVVYHISLMHMCYRSFNNCCGITPRSISGLTAFHFTRGYSLYTATAVSAKECSQYLENLKRQAEKWGGKIDQTFSSNY